MDFLPNWAIDVFKVLGPSAGILLIWWISHRSSEKRFDTFMTTLDEQRKELITQIEKERESHRLDRQAYATEFIEIRNNSHENQKLMTELMRQQTQILARIEPVVVAILDLHNKNTISLAVIDNKIDHI